MPFCLVARHHFSILVEGKEHSCKVISKSINWFRRRFLLINCCQMHDSLCSFSIFSSVGHFVKPKGIILAILVKGHKRNISVK